MSQMCYYSNLLRKLEFHEMLYDWQHSHFPHGMIGF
jgi:hypothetical protein